MLRERRKVGGVGTRRLPGRPDRLDCSRVVQPPRRVHRLIDPRWSLAGCFFVAAIAGFVQPVFTQSSFDVQEGKVLFAGLCVTCHGFEGGGGDAPPLNRPKLLAAPDDEALRRIISEGIPNRGMPRVRRTTENELRQLVAYVRSLGRTPPPPVKGNARSGADLYAKLGCAGCHIVNGQGDSLGPSLSDVGWLRGAQYLRQALLEPGAALPRGTLPIPSRGYVEFLPVQVVGRDGTVVRGVRLNEDVFTIQLRDATGRIHSFRKSDVKSVTKEPGASLMPSYANRLSAVELDDLVAYLSTLGGAQ